MKKGKEMYSLRGAILGLAALAMLPLATQATGLQPNATLPRVSGASAVTEPKPSAKVDAADLEAWLDGYVPYALERGHVPGAVVVVVQGDKVLLQKGYGFSDLVKRTAVDPAKTLFRPGSVSKLFTWTAVMQQVEAGKLDLDTDINSYLDFKIPPYNGKPITLRHIMTHTAGFEESARYLFGSGSKSLIPMNKLMPLALPQRVFAPGTTPAYSNYATSLAGYIVQRVSGETFDDYIDNHIFKPLGMKESSFRQPLPSRLAPLMSQGYPDSTQKPKPFEFVLPAPAGSLSASGADMGKFMIAHLNEGMGLMRAETAQTMHDYKAPGIGPLNKMALGFYEQTANGHRVIAHGGDTDWFHSHLWLFPTADIGLYISMNGNGKEGASSAIRSSLLHKFADRYLPGGDKPSTVDVKTARAHAQSMVGNYISSRAAFTNFISLVGLLEQTSVSLTPDGKITVPGLDGLSAGPRDWVEVEPYVWRDINTGERLAAEVKDGRVVRFSLDAVSPIVVFKPAPASANTAWLHPALIAALGIIVLTAFAWPVRALVRRNFGATLPFEGKARRAYRLSRIFAWAVLAAVAGWLGLLATASADITKLGGALDWLIQLLRSFTPVAVLGLLAAAAWHFWLCWSAKRRWATKFGAFLLVLTALLFVWITFAYHLYGFGMVY
jgi:CubicO group peptidase (beta-lactamase class C family)